MENAIVIAVLLIITGLAVRYVYKQKKKGTKCIGCPYCDTCSSKENGCCNDR